MDEEDEREYTDYRKYFVYDMEIVSRQGGSEIVSAFQKQGSASNGEKQTPYFIILAASLLQVLIRERPAVQGWPLSMRHFRRSHGRGSSRW